MRYAFIYICLWFQITHEEAEKYGIKIKDKGIGTYSIEDAYEVSYDSYTVLNTVVTYIDWHAYLLSGRGGGVCEWCHSSSLCSKVKLVNNHTAT